MYKCTECGCEFENRPDFCDCGNDEFVLVEEKKEESKKTEIPVEPKILESNPPELVSKLVEEPVNELKQNYSYQNTNQRFTKPPVDFISLGIFLGCILLSLVVIFFLWNPKEIEVTETKESIKPIAQNIPSSIDKFWNDAVPKIVKENNQVEQTEQTKPAPVQKTVIPAVTKQTAPPSGITTVKKQTTTASQPKPTQKTNTQKPVTTKPTAQNTTKPTVQQTTKPAAQTAPKQTTQPVAQSQTAAPSQVVVTKPAETQVQQQTPIQTKSSQELAQELANYKASLRNTIGRKIDFTRVLGDGTCAVSFKINESGKLINRSFSQQSTNITLNDAVYAAVMSTPTFKAPPEGYKGQFLKLSIKFYNGNFEISLD